MSTLPEAPPSRICVAFIQSSLSRSQPPLSSADTAEDLEDIAQNYKVHSIPLDVLVSDMAWHYQPDLETGYTWGPQLFPRPEQFLSSVDALGLNTTLNLHLRPIAPPPATKASSWSKFLHRLGLVSSEAICHCL